MSLGGGYANADGGALEPKRHRELEVVLTPIAAVGWSASEAKSAKGCQNQKWVKTPMPTIADAIRCPVFETNEMPIAAAGVKEAGGMIAPIFAIVLVFVRHHLRERSGARRAPSSRLVL